MMTFLHMTKNMKNNSACKESNRHASHPSTYSNVDLGLNMGDQCDFVCGTMSHAKLSLVGSVMHYQTTFE